MFALSCATVVWSVAVKVLLRIARHYEKRDIERANRLTRIAIAISLTPYLKHLFPLMESTRHHDIGEARRRAERARSAIRPGTLWTIPNLTINAFVFCGLYREALAIERLVSEPRHRYPDLRTWYVLAQINLAEAQYNLGDWEGASARLDAIADEAIANPLNRVGISLQRAWIAAHQGLDVAVRASSVRNGYFVVARIHVKRKDIVEARRWFEQGRTHPYIGQGGSELVAYGDLLETLGAKDEAREVWQLAVDRDPQSEGAAVAKARMSGADGASA